jgi:asparagine synthase (glutamine-hydrolysing)
MPGIAGLISAVATPRKHVAELEQMLSTMLRGGRYNSGIYSDESSGTYAGWAMHEGSFADCMPVTSQSRDCVLLFAGEHFATPSLTSARSLMPVYEEAGDKFLSLLNGWFSGLLINLPEARITLFNDRFGLGRIYYYQSDDAFYFSSEAKAILGVRSEVRELDPQGLSEFVSRDCVLEDRTLFKGINLLPAGSAWIFDRGRLRQRASYFSFKTWESNEPSMVPEQQVVEMLRNTLVRVLPPYLEPNDSTALSLTGGLDSRLIVAAARERAARLPSYTFAGSRDTMDVRQSRRVAEVAGMSHQVIRLGEDFFRDFPKLAEETVYLSDGALGPNGAHDLYFNRLARLVAPIRLTGLLGSEVLRQGRILPRLPRVDALLTSELAPHIEQADRLVESYRREHPVTAAICRDAVWRGHGSRAIERSQVVLRSPFTDNDLVAVMYSVPNVFRESASVEHTLLVQLDGDLGQVRYSRGYQPGQGGVGDIRRRLVNALLWAQFKADYVYLFSTPPWLVKCDPLITGLRLRHLVFGYHKFERYRFWYREKFRSYVSDVLLDPRTLERPYFNRQQLRKIVEDHLANRANHVFELHKALALELTARTLLVAPSLARDTLAEVPAAAR